MSNFRKLTGLIVITALSTVFTGCGNSQGVASNEKQAATEVKPKEPATVKMFTHLNGISDDRLQKYVIEPLKQKAPHITFEVIKDGKGSTIEDLVSSGTFPDLYYGSNVQFPAFLNKELQFDMNDLIKKNNFDLTRFDSAYIDAIKTFGDKGQLYGIPFSTNLGVQIYNKDIFDRFGVPYPKDGMNWDEILELGRKVTRAQDGVNYIGFDPGTITDVGQALSLPYVDTKSLTALVDNDQWRRIFDLFQKAYAVPGYVNAGKYDYGNNGFWKDKVLAMKPIWSLQIVNAKTDLAPMNWDVVTLPNFKDALGQSREVDIHMIAISNVSKNKEAALEVLKVITSDEVQKMMSEEGTPAVMKNDAIKKAYGTKLPEFQGKNIAAFTKTSPRVPHVITKYDGTVRTPINNARKELAAGKKDVNTILREVQEESNQKLKEFK